MNTHTDEEIRKVLIDRLEKEIQQQIDTGKSCHTDSFIYMTGYYEAIRNIMSDLLYDERVSKQWKDYVEGLIRSGNINILNKAVEMTNRKWMKYM